MLTRALLVLLAMMTGLAAGPAEAVARATESTVSISVVPGVADAARAEARVVPYARLAGDAPVAETPAIPCSSCELAVGRTVERGDRARE